MAERIATKASGLVTTAAQSITIECVDGRLLVAVRSVANTMYE